MGKGKCTCGKLIDQADSVISFVIVMLMCECKNRQEISVKRASILSLKDIGVTEFLPVERQLFITRKVGGQDRSSHSYSHTHTLLLTECDSQR